MQFSYLMIIMIISIINQFKLAVEDKYNVITMKLFGSIARGDNTEISNAIIMGNDSYETLDEMEKLGNVPKRGIGANCQIRNAIIDKDVRIGDNVLIHGSVSLTDTETDTYCIRDGVIVVKKGAIITSGTRIGLGA